MRKRNFISVFELEVPNTQGLYELNIEEAGNYGLSKQDLEAPLKFRCGSVGFRKPAEPYEEEGFDGKVR